MPLTPEEVYDRIKELEGVFPLPIPSEVISVGRFDCSSGEFSGLKVDVFYESVADLFPGGYPGDRIWYVGNKRMEMHRRGSRVEFRAIPSPKIEAVHAHLTFRLDNPNTCSDNTWYVTVNSMTNSAPTSQETMTLNVRDSTWIEWSIQVGNHSYEGELELRREPNIGVGVFTLPAIPLLILYEPPCDSENESTATYRTTFSFSTELTTSFSTEEATTRPVAPQGYLGTQDAKSKLNTLATVFDNVPIPGGEAIPGALRSIATGLGEMNAELTEGQINATEETLRTTFQTQDSWSTGECDGGPGVGDIIVYLSNVKMLWVVYNGNFTLTPLGWDGEHSHSVQWISENLDAELAQELLKLDPFTDDEFSELDPNRFQYKTTFDISGMGGCRESEHSHTVEQIDRSTTTNYTTRVENYRPGWLSFLGLGVTEEKTVKTTITQSCSTAESVLHQNSVMARLCADSNENYIVSIYYDRVFGTFAFEPPPAFSKPLISGVITTPVGLPVAHESVTLISAGKSFKTFSNKDGIFRFYAWSIKPGKGKLILRKSISKKIELKPGIPMHDITLKLP
jgi:hypothetical protein